MDIASLIGLILCFVLVLYGIITGESIAGVKYFLDVPSALITFGGAIGATMASVSMADFIGGLKSIGMIFKPVSTNIPEMITKIIELSNVARKEGLLSLEEAAGAAVDFKSSLMESFQASSEQMGGTMSAEQLEEMFPALMAGVIAVYAVLALIALAIVITLIYAVFRSNNRLPKQVFKVDHSDTAYVMKKDGSMKKNRMIDIWLVIFIVYTLYECLVSAGVF